MKDFEFLLLTLMLFGHVLFSKTKKINLNFDGLIDLSYEITKKEIVKEWNISLQH